MNRNRRSTFALLILLICALTTCVLAAATESSKVGRLELNTVTGTRPITGGIEVRSGKAILRVVALRDDLLRVRIAPDGVFPEDASWAVLPGARTHTVAVTAESDAHSVGFRTSELRVVVERPDLRLRILDLQGNVLQEDSKIYSSQFAHGGFTTYKEMPEKEHYFGLGDKAGPLDRRNQSFTLWSSDTYSFQESSDPIYKSIPFFLAFREGRTIGVLFDNTWRTHFDFGKQFRGVYSFGSEGGPADYYIIYGPSAKKVLSSYMWLTGPTPLPPLWTLGYQQSRYSYETEAELRSIANKLREDRIPADALYLDIDFQEKNRPFTVSTDKFPHFSEMVGDLKKQNFHVVAITDLHIAELPDAGYAAYDSGKAGDHFVKNPDGSTYVGTVWPGPSVFPDFTRQKTRDWWGSLYTDLLKTGVAGFWNDMNEPSVFKTPDGTMPASIQHRIEEPGFIPRNATHAEIHNVLGMENSRATYEGLLKLSPDQRPFVLTRATYAGGQRYSATWTGDNSSTWNHLRLAIPMLQNLGLSGFGLTGADVGGFIGSPQPDLLTKWIELGTFQPIDRNHTEKGTKYQEPWVHGPEHEKIRRRFIEERYRLMPYIYTLAEEMSRTGWPMMRPIFMEFPNASLNDRPLDTTPISQYMFGPNLLIAPPPYPDEVDDYQARLPAVGWYDYWTGKRVAKADANATAASSELTNTTITPRLEELPVFVKEGTILPVQPLTQSTEEVPNGPLTLRIYPGSDCHGSIYQDDGKTMAFKRGEYLRVQFSCEPTSQGLKVNVGAREGRFQPWWKQLRIEVYDWSAATTRVTAGGKELPTIPGTPGSQVAIFEISDDGKGAEIVLNGN